MPAPKLFLTSADIAAVTGISLRQAQYVLNMFEQRGQAIRNGRIKLVDINILSRYDHVLTTHNMRNKPVCARYARRPI